MAWGRFCELLPILTSKNVYLKTHGSIYNSCVRGAMLNASECWTRKKADLHSHQRNGRAMMRWLCGVKNSDNIYDHISTAELTKKLDVSDLGAAISSRRLSKMVRSCQERRYMDCQDVCPSHQWINSERKAKETWAEAIKSDLREYGLSAWDAFVRVQWKSIVRQKYNHAASHLL